MLCFLILIALGFFFGDVGDDACDGFEGIVRSSSLETRNIFIIERQTIKHNESETPLLSEIHQFQTEPQLSPDADMDDEATMTCCNRIKSHSKVLHQILLKCTFAINGIRKGVALWSTAFMVDCKLTDGGHLGPECMTDIRVLQSDQGTHIYQNNIEHHIPALDAKNECLLPYCSAIHPSRLNMYKIKHPDIYEKCFYDPCKSVDIKCDAAPSYAKCEMITRDAENIYDWCLPKWVDPNRTGLAFEYVIWDNDRAILKEWKKLLTYNFDCKTGMECCRFSMGPDVTRQDVENLGNLTLEAACAMLSSENSFIRQTVLQLLASLFGKGYEFESVFSDRMPIRTWSKKDLQHLDASVQSGGKHHYKKSEDSLAKLYKDYGISLSDLEAALRQEYISNNLCVTAVLSSEDSITFSGTVSR